MIAIILLLLALVAFALAAVGVPGRLNWVGVGLALVAFMWLLQAVGVNVAAR